MTELTISSSCRVLAGYSHVERGRAKPTRPARSARQAWLTVCERASALRPRVVDLPLLEVREEGPDPRPRGLDRPLPERLGADSPWTIEDATPSSMTAVQHSAGRREAIGCAPIGWLPGSGATVPNKSGE